MGRLLRCGVASGSGVSEPGGGLSRGSPGLGSDAAGDGGRGRRPVRRDRVRHDGWLDQRGEPRRDVGGGLADRHRRRADRRAGGGGGLGRRRPDGDRGGHERRLGARVRARRDAGVGLAGEPWGRGRTRTSRSATWVGSRRGVWSRRATIGWSSSGTTERWCSPLAGDLLRHVHPPGGDRGRGRRRGDRDRVAEGELVSTCTRSTR